MKMTSLFLSQTELHIGEGSLAKIVDIINEQKAKNVFVVTDKSLQEAGVTEPLYRYLREMEVNYKVFDGVKPDPTEQVIHDAFHELKSFQADLLIGIGGGSSIDSAKAIGILATNGGKIGDYRGVDKVKNDILPLVAIPTTAGTGSEVTMVTVVISEEEKLKYSIGGKQLAAKWAIIDPQLTMTVPPRITAYTGIDALTHAIEAYTSKLSFSITDAIAKDAIRFIGENLRTAVHQGSSRSARQKMHEASLMAGLAFSNAKLGLCHVLCNPLGAHFNIPHGLANAILLPYVTKFNIPARLEKYAHVAKLLGEETEGLSLREAAEKTISAIVSLNEDINIPRTLKEVGVKEEMLEQMVEDCYQNPLVHINPRYASKEDLLTIYKNAYEGVF